MSSSSDGAFKKFNKFYALMQHFWFILKNSQLQVSVLFQKFFIKLRLKVLLSGSIIWNWGL